MKALFKDFKHEIIEKDINIAVAKIKKESVSLYNVENLKLIFSLIDLTFLSCTDNNSGIKKVINQVNNFDKNYPEMPTVAAICVYPNYIEDFHKKISLKNIKLASVVGGFPASQTFLEIKTKEARLAIQVGANECDMVMSIGEFLNNEYQHVFHEIHKVKRAINENTLKVILETGVLKDYLKIFKASILAMEAGADFVKTSTGKEKTGATPESVYVMALAVKDFYERTGKKIGIKPAGGIANGADALIYINIIKNVLGNEWLKPNLFRFGTSSLANKIINEIYQNTDKYFDSSNYY